MSDLYLATITVTVPLRIDGPKRIGGVEHGPDAIAAWEAASTLGYLIGDGIREAMASDGHESPIGMTGDVTRLERLQAGCDVEPRWERAAGGQADG